MILGSVLVPQAEIGAHRHAEGGVGHLWSVVGPMSWPIWSTTNGSEP